MRDYIITPYKEKYLDNILNIYNYYVSNSTSTFHIETLTEELMKDWIIPADSKYGTYVILNSKNSDEVCGYCTLSPHSKKEAYSGTAMISIYLSNNYTGKGLGRMAIEYLESKAIDKGIRVILAGVCAENESSRRLFESCGYEQSGYFKEVGNKFGRILDVVYYQKSRFAIPGIIPDANGRGKPDTFMSKKVD